MAQQNINVNRPYNSPLFRDQVREFSDFDLDFRTHPLTGDLLVKRNQDSVKQSVKNIILTVLGERGFDQDFGSTTNELLFDFMDSITQDRLRDSILTALSNYEPRVIIRSVEVDTREADHFLEMTLKFRIINTIEPVSVNVFMRRVR